MQDSITSDLADFVTPDQVEAARKLAIIGWKWNTETIQKGVVRLRNQVELDLPGRHRLGSSILIAEIHPNGAVKMGDACDGISVAATRARQAALASRRAA